MLWTILLSSFLTVNSNADTLYGAEFLERQLSFERVQTALDDKLNYVQRLFKQKRVAFPSAQLYIRAFKSEGEFELWAYSTTMRKNVLLKSYKICQKSGVMGPKRMQGDRQVPEGFYEIEVFNPVSNYFLSLGLNYPNESDRILTSGKDPGGDIYIHGACVTIGCLPMTDEMMKEIYLACIYARSAGQNEIPVHIYPMRLTNDKMEKLRSIRNSKPKLVDFWETLKTAYDLFEVHGTVPLYNILPDGSYKITNALQAKQ